MKFPLLLPAGLLATAGVFSACQTIMPAAATAAAPMVDAPIWQSDAYTLYRDRVVQGLYEAHALSATELVSNYMSPASDFQSSQV